MILWFTGNTGAGKTTTVFNLERPNTIRLDGDELRGVWNDLGLSIQDRTENCVRIARLAKNFEAQGYCVLVSVIAPTNLIREKITRICNPVFIYVPGGAENTSETPYEVPNTLLKVNK